MNKIKNRGNLYLLAICLTVAISFPFLLTNCGGSSSSTKASTAGKSRYLYVAALSGASNALLKIDTATNTQVGVQEIGFTPTFPANQINGGTVFWGTQGSSLYGFDVAAGASRLRTVWERNLALKMLAEAYNYVAPPTADAFTVENIPSCGIPESGPDLATLRAAVATGVAHAGGGSWTAVSSDGATILVASRVDKASENGLYQAYDTSGNIKYTLDPVTGETKNSAGSTINTASTKYSGYGGSMPGSNPGLGKEKARAGSCDISIVSTGGAEYGWGVDVNGDTLTGFNVSTGSMVAQGVYMPLGPGEMSAGFVGPFMETAGKAANGMSIATTENLKGSNSGGSESIWNLSTPGSPVELVRIYDSFAGWNFKSGSLANYTNVTSKYSSKLKGAVSTTIYEWASPGAGYPRFIVDGAASGVTSEIEPNGKFAYIFAGGSVPVIDLSGDAPWVVSNTIKLSTGGAIVGAFSADGSKCYVSTGGGNAGSLPVIDTSTHTMTDLIPITGQARGMAMM